MKLTLPTDSTARKEYSLSAGCYAYFPAALAGVARHSYIVGAKHTHGNLEHRRWLSGDHGDCIERHMMDLRDMLAAFLRGPQKAVGVIDTDVGALLDECNALVWRAMALSQEMHERFGGAPLAPAAKLQPTPETPAIEKKPPIPGVNYEDMLAGLTQKAEWLCNRSVACSRPKGHPDDCF